MICDAARGYAQDKLMPRGPQRTARSASTARSCLRWAQGLIGATVAEEYGGGGASHIAGLIAREIERVDPATAR
ncbi:MAG: acyl-CoA dehydrogenase family protein [Parvularculaceae bacterium]